MDHDQTEWWPANDTRAALLLRYQLLLAGPAVALRMETTAPDDPEQIQDTCGFQFLLDAAGCRLLGEHLLQTAELLEAQKKPMN